MSLRSFREREVKACQPCAKAKVRCETGGRLEKCRRCQRLNKECGNQRPGSHRQRNMVKVKYNRDDLLRLESKVDSVSTYLSRATTPLPLPLPTFSFSAPTPATASASIPVNQDEAISFLSHFRAEMAPLFPFVVIPEDVTPEQLRVEKPTLYMAIMMVSCQSDVDRQLTLAHMVMKEISEAILIRSEKSIALLEAMLVYVAWDHMHQQLGRQLFNILHLAVSMLLDLGLNKEPCDGSKTGAGAFTELSKAKAMDEERTVEERRIFLGVFWVSSLSKMCFRDMETVRLTKYVDSCCHVLEEAIQQPTDVYLVKSVRLQQKAEHISEILYSKDPCITPVMSAPMAMAISSLEKEVVELGLALPPDIPQASLLLMSYQTLQLYLYKIALDERLFRSSICSPFANFRINCLASCLAAIGALLSIFLSLPARTLFSLPHPNWGQMAHALLVLSRLSEVRHGTWNASYVSGVLDFPETCKTLAGKLDEAMTTGMEEIPPRMLPSIFKKLVGRLRVLGEESAKQNVEEPEALGGEEFLLGEEMMNPMLFDFFDLGQGM